MGFSWQELIIVLVIVLVLFGPKRLPEIGSSLGKGIRSFKDSVNGTEKPTAASITSAHSVHKATTTAPVAEPVAVEVVESDEPTVGK